MSDAYFRIIEALLTYLQDPGRKVPLSLREQLTSAVVLLSNQNLQPSDLAHMNRTAMLSFLRPFLLLDPSASPALLSAFDKFVKAPPLVEETALAQQSSWALHFSTFSLFRLLYFVSTRYELSRIDPAITYDFDCLREYLVTQLLSQLLHGLAFIKTASEQLSSAAGTVAEEPQEEATAVSPLVKMSAPQELSTMTRSGHSH